MVRGEGKGTGCGIRRRLFRILWLFASGVIVFFSADLKKVNGNNTGEEGILKGAETNRPFGLYTVSWECT